MGVRIWSSKRVCQYGVVVIILGVIWGCTWSIVGCVCVGVRLMLWWGVVYEWLL